MVGRGDGRLNRGVLIVGTGLLGTSLGLALSRVGIDVRLNDISDESVAAAVSRGAGRAAKNDDSRASLAVVAVPPEAVGQTVVDLIERSAAEHVTDVASVKELPAAFVRSHAKQPGRYVGGHPMAGREVSGPQAALVDLFEGRPWVVCPDEQTDHEAVTRTFAIARLVGANPVSMPAPEHDAAVALVSHAPHLMSALMAGRLADAPAHEVRLAGAGVNDVTRVAASDPRLWSEILTANASAVAAVLREVRDDLDEVLASLHDAGDVDVLGQLLQSGVDGRARLPGKHGAPHMEFATVFVVVDDRPGQLARLFGEADTAGVNIEDVRIDHVPGQAEGVVELDVQTGADGTLRDHLSSHGWTIR